MVEQNNRSTDLKTNVDTDTQWGEIVKINTVYCVSIDLKLLCYYFYTFKTLCSHKMFAALEGRHLPL